MRATTWEVKNGKFTGRILTHPGNIGKRNVVEEFCGKYGVGRGNWAAIGDSEPDNDLFEMCAKSIAINYSSALEGRASNYFMTEDLSEIINVLCDWILE